MQNAYNTRQAQFFDKTAKKIGTLNIDTMRSEIRHEFDALIELLPDLKDKKILDLGCGTGRLSLELAQHAKEVVGIDISPKSIEYANKVAKKYDISNFKGIVRDFNDVSFVNSFDYIVCLNLIHHTTNLDKPFKKIKRALKPNGRFIIFEFNPLNPLFPIFLWKIGQFGIHANKEYIRSNMYTMSKILSRNGFSVMLYRHALLPTSLYSYSPLFKQVNKFLNKVPILNQLCAYNIFICSIKK